MSSEYDDELRRQLIRQKMINIETYWERLKSKKGRVL